MIRKSTTKKDMKVLIGQPIDYPNELVSTLINCFKKNKTIKRAYLACVRYPELDQSLKLVIAVDTNEDVSSITVSIAGKLDELKLNGEVIDFVNLKSTPFEKYFIKTLPFYDASNGS